MSSSSSDLQSQQVRRTGDIFPFLSSTIVCERYDPSTILQNTRRRVNPDSLANRLGPELVKELGALLRPGVTEMPSFTARQAIQKKYNIDRRHIYDWYHTKGLRVSTKEKDKAVDHEAKVLRSRTTVSDWLYAVLAKCIQ